MPDFVEIAVVFALYFSILLGRNDNVYSGRKRESNDFRCVIATICQKILGVYSLDKGLNPKFCVNSQRGENRSEFNVCGSGFIRLPPCVQYNAGGDGCQGRRQGRRSSERRAAARRPLTSGPGGVIRACVRQSRWTAARESGSSPAAVPSTFS